MITYPKNGIWNQPNIGKTQGSFYSTFNVDVSEEEGRLRGAKRLVLNSNTTDLTDMTSYPSAFERNSTSAIYAFAGSGGVGYAFKNDGSSPAVAFNKDTSGSYPQYFDSLYSDAKVLNGVMYATGATNSVYYQSSGTWNNFGVTSNSGTDVRMLCPYNGRMYMSTNSSTIISWDSSRSLATIGSNYTLSLGEDLVITFMRAVSDGIWIGTVNPYGGKGKIFKWDGVSSATFITYRLESSGALSCVIKDDIPWIFDSRANLLAFNGGTFKKMTGFFKEKGFLLTNSTSVKNNRFIHPNGMAIIKNKIHLNINNKNADNTGSIEMAINSGIYEYDENKNDLIHKGSYGLSKSLDTIVDYGAIRISGVGALSEMYINDTSTTRNGSFLAGCTYYTSASATTSGIFYDDLNDTLQKACSFILSKAEADDATSFHFTSVENDYLSFYEIYRQLLSNTDKIVVKYRTLEITPIEITLTWASTTTFTTTTDLTSYKGYEIEILQGIGSGKCAHITNVTGSGTYTITVDETFVSASGTAIGRITNWKKVSVITQNNQNYNSDTISDKATWIQFKVWALFTGKNEFERFILTNSNIMPAK